MDFTELFWQPSMSVDEVIESMREQVMGQTDCALPMLWATEHEETFDAFVIITDTETWWNEVSYIPDRV